MKKVGIYDPFLDTLGGGEKYILSILQVLTENRYDVDIFWDKNISQEIKRRFQFDFIDSINFIPNIFKKYSPIKKFITLKKYDCFFYMTDGSYFFSGAKNNYIYAMIPDRKLYDLKLSNRLKLQNYEFITHSDFTQKWLKKFKIDSKVIMPYLDKRLINQEIDLNKKEKTILSVGRFFSHLHSKRQDLMIKYFKELKKQSKEFSDYKLIFAGGLIDEDKKYFDGLKKIAGDDSLIIFKPNISVNELDKLYKQATFYWHFTGYSIDEEKNPELVEHFGITPLEAMASGCLTFCYAAGGPKELIQDGENGFLFSDEDELIDKMIKVDSNKTLKEKVIKNAKRFVRENFSYQTFRSKVMELFKVRPSSPKD